MIVNDLQRLQKSLRFFFFVLLLGLSIWPTSAVLVTWNTNPPTDSVDGYRLYYVLDGQTNFISVGKVTTAALPNLQPGSNYTIFVSAFNNVGESDYSSSIEYLAPADAVPPAISQQPTDLGLMVGDLLSLSVAVDPLATAPLQFDWFRDGIAVPGANSTTYSVASARLAHAGTYVVRISNPIGAITSAPVAVTISAPPSISIQPQSLSVLEGTRASFSVTASGVPTPTFQWQKDGVEIPGATGSSFEIASAQAPDAGDYTVVVQNSAGSVTSAPPAILMVVPPPAAVLPVISGPIDLTVAEEQAIELSVAVTGGTAPFSFAWFKNGVSLPEETTNSFSISSAQQSDMADYFVVVSNAAGSVTSAVVHVTVFAHLEIISQPLARSVNSGSAIEFAVVVSGSPPLYYQWFKDDALLIGQTNATLTLTSLKPSDAGMYNVRVYNGFGEVFSVPTPLLVNGVPGITSQPIDIVVLQGSPANFSAVAAGSGLIRYQWYKNGILIPGAIGASYSIGSAQPSDEGSYIVQITDLNGAVISSPSRLHVISPPSILSQPSNVHIFLGQQAQFLVQASTAGVAYQWLKNGQEIAGATSSSLVIGKAEYSDLGNYSVRVSNEAGSVLSAHATLEIDGPPLITSEPPANLEAQEGTAFTFFVAALGASPLQYQWYKNGSPIADATGAIFSLSSPTQADNGLYWVVVRNSFGLAQSRITSMRVLMLPTISQQPENIISRVGEGVAFHVAAQSGTAIQYQWYKGNSALLGQTTETLNLSSVQPEDAGSYNVQVSNAAGSVFSRDVTLTVRTAARIITEPVGGSVAESSSISLTVGAIGSVPLRYQWYKGEAAIVDATNDTLVIAEATTASAGQYKVKVSNDVGSATSAGAEVTVLTRPVLVTQPLSISLNEGARGPFSLRAIASGSGALEYQWFKDDVALPGATAPELAFSTVLHADAGTYRLRVSNTQGTVLSDAAVITVLTGPLIVQQPAGGTFFEGALLQLSVQATGSDPIQYQWFRNNVPIPGATSPNYRVASASASDAGIYTVSLVNAVRSIASQAAEVIVLVPPRITISTLNQTLNEGDRLLLSSQASGTGPLKVQWLKNGVSLLGATTANLLIYGVDRTDAGVYSARVTSPNGTNTSSGITIRVNTGTSDATVPNGNALAIKSLNRLVLSSTATPGEEFVLQTSADLGINEWQDVGSATVNEAGTFEFHIRGDLPNSAAFFRLKKP